MNPRSNHALARHPVLAMPDAHPGGRLRAAAEEPVGEQQITPFGAIPCPLLRAAAERVMAKWPDDPTDLAADARAADLVGLLVRAIHEHRSGRGLVPPLLAATPLGRRLLDSVRTALLDGLDSKGLLLQTLRSVEAVKRLIEPMFVDNFAAHLSGPYAAEVLVEVAHDLRSPLTSILFLAETLQRGQSGDVNDLQRRQLGLIYGAAFGLSMLASDLIELARGGGDRLVERQAETLSVAETLDSVRDLVRPLAEEKRLTIRVTPPSHDCRRGHPLALGRVVLNLATNALKFTEEGFVELVARETAPERVEFSVRDTGNGVNPDVLQSLHAAFRKAPARDGFAFSGSGLGLTICQRLVHAMGSELQVETRAGWGTRFFFEVHLPRAGDPISPQWGLAVKPSTGVPSTSRRAVLQA